MLAALALDVAAAGSWVASAPPVRVSMVERESLSAPLLPPSALREGKIHSLVWRFKVSPGAALRARICQAEHCITAEQMRGRSQAMAGLPATQPLHFQFSLLPQQTRAVVVGELQLIVNYQ
jgi:flagellar protein FlhE